MAEPVTIAMTSPPSPLTQTLRTAESASMVLDGSIGVGPTERFHAYDSRSQQSFGHLQQRLLQMALG